MGEGQEKVARDTGLAFLFLESSFLEFQSLCSFLRSDLLKGCGWESVILGSQDQSFHPSMFQPITDCSSFTGPYIWGEKQCCLRHWWLGHFAELPLGNWRLGLCVRWTHSLCPENSSCFHLYQNDLKKTCVARSPCLSLLHFCNRRVQVLILITHTNSGYMCELEDVLLKTPDIEEAFRRLQWTLGSCLYLR